MKYSHYIITLLLFFVLVSCNKTDNKSDASSIDPLANIVHEDGWSIVSKIEDGNRVYWFLAPEINNVSPAMFKKIIYSNQKSELEVKVVSQCDAPKQICDDLMTKYKILSKNYN